MLIEVECQLFETRLKQPVFSDSVQVPDIASACILLSESINEQVSIADRPRNVKIAPLNSEARKYIWGVGIFIMIETSYFLRIIDIENPLSTDDDGPELFDGESSIEVLDRPNAVKPSELGKDLYFDDRIGNDGIDPSDADDGDEYPDDDKDLSLSDQVPFSIYYQVYALERVSAISADEQENHMRELMHRDCDLVSFIRNSPKLANRHLIFLPEELRQLASTIIFNRNKRIISGKVETSKDWDDFIEQKLHQFKAVLLEAMINQSKNFPKLRIDLKRIREN